jgi:hypothetical protein
MENNARHQQWWDRLQPETRQRLAREPGVVPLDLWPAVTSAGGLAVGAWWPGAHQGPDAAHLSREVTEFIEADNQRLLHELEVQYALHQKSVEYVGTPVDQQIPPESHAGHFEELLIEAEARGLEIPQRLRRS